MRQYAVGLGLLFPGPDLPGPVHFIAQTPGPDAIGRRMPVLPPQVRPPCAAGEIGVFHAVHGVLQRARAQIHRIDRLSSRLFRPLQIFIVSHIIGNILMPCRIQMCFPVLHGPDGILPLPSGHKIPAGQPDTGKPRVPERCIEILPEPLRIRAWMLRVVHASVDHGPDGLQERPEQPGRNLADPV